MRSQDCLFGAVASDSTACGRVADLTRNPHSLLRLDVARRLMRQAAYAAGVRPQPCQGRMWVDVSRQTARASGRRRSLLRNRSAHVLHQPALVRGKLSERSASPLQPSTDPTSNHP